MERLTDGLKKILLAGIGTVAVTAEKSKEVLDEMVKRGELTVEQGKVLNQELKHNIKDTVKKNVNVSVKPQSPEELEELLDKMTPEQIQALKSKLAQMDEADVDEEADESVFEDEDVVTDTTDDEKSTSGEESQSVEIKIEAEDDHLCACLLHGVGKLDEVLVAQLGSVVGVEVVAYAVHKLELGTQLEERQVEIASGTNL